MKVSVIVPVYNVENYLEQCVDSIINSDYTDIEIVLVDDGSPDKCPTICDKYALEDDRIRVIHKPNAGLVSAWKAGLRESTGEYVVFVDSDDWIDRDLIGRALRCAMDNGVKMVCYNWIRNDDKNTCYDFPITGKVVIDDVMDNIIYYRGSNKIIPNSRCTKLVAREVALKAMEYCGEDVTLGEDQQFTIACVLQVAEVFVASELQGYHYRINNTSMVHTYNKNLYNKVNSVLDWISKAFDALSDFDYRDQLAKESVIYGVHVMSNAFFTKSPKQDITQVFEDERMSYGAKIIDYSALRPYDRLMAKAIAKKSYWRVALTRKLFDLKQALRRG